jgi:hypothetical protein
MVGQRGQIDMQMHDHFEGTDESMCARRTSVLRENREQSCSRPLVGRSYNF